MYNWSKICPMLFTGLEMSASLIGLKYVGLQNSTLMYFAK